MSLPKYILIRYGIAVAWHPTHPLLVSGGSEGAVLHWDLSTPDPELGAQPISLPRATLSQAHDSNVWSLAFHPLGHLLASASNDHTTRFWSRERPGDASSVFSGGGEKPPEIVDMSGQDDDDDAMVPGFGYAGAGGSTGTWWGKDEQGGAGAQANGSGGMVGENGFSRMGVGESGDTTAADDFIPGFGSSDNSAAQRQQDTYGSEDWNRGGGGGAGGSGSGGGAGDEWRGGNRSGRWGPAARRGGGGPRY